MYYPYLRGKQNELMALSELKSDLDWEQVIPIVEPVKTNLSRLKKILSGFDIQGSGIIIIINPAVGDWKDSKKHAQLILELESIQRERTITNPLPPIIYGIIIQDKMPPQTFENYFKKAGNKEIALIHKGLKSSSELFVYLKSKDYHFHSNIFHEGYFSTKYKDTYSKIAAKNIWLKDNFTVRRSVDYIDSIDEFYSEIHKRYMELGFEGFGDYQIVGEHFSASGWTPKAVVIHLTYINEDGEIWLKHFISDDMESDQNIEEKFYQALNKLINFLDDNEMVYRSQGIKEFYELYRTRHYPGLGVVKKLSIKHHIELLSSNLEYSQR